jgi:hypothetical protein
VELAPGGGVGAGTGGRRLELAPGGGTGGRRLELQHWEEVGAGTGEELERLGADSLGHCTTLGCCF